MNKLHIIKTLFLRILVLSFSVHFFNANAIEPTAELKALLDPNQYIASCQIAYSKNSDIGVPGYTNGQTLAKVSLFPGGYYINYTTNWGLPGKNFSTEKGDRYWVGESRTEYWRLNGGGSLQVGPKVDINSLEEAIASKSLLARQAVRDRVFLRGAIAFGLYFLDLRGLKWISEDRFQVPVGTLLNPVSHIEMADGLVEESDRLTGAVKITTRIKRNKDVVFEAVTTGHIHTSASLGFDAITLVHDKRFPQRDAASINQLHTTMFSARDIKLQTEDSVPEGYRASDIVPPESVVKQMTVYSNNFTRHQVKDNGVVVALDNPSDVQTEGGFKTKRIMLTGITIIGIVATIIIIKQRR